MYAKYIENSEIAMIEIYKFNSNSFHLLIPAPHPGSPPSLLSYHGPYAPPSSNDINVNVNKAYFYTRSICMRILSIRRRFRSHKKSSFKFMDKFYFTFK